MNVEYAPKSTYARLIIKSVEIQDEASYKCEITYLEVRENCDVVQIIKLSTLGELLRWEKRGRTLGLSLYRCVYVCDANVCPRRLLFACGAFVFRRRVRVSFGVVEAAGEGSDTFFTSPSSIELLIARNDVYATVRGVKCHWLRCIYVVIVREVGACRNVESSS